MDINFLMGGNFIRSVDDTTSKVSRSIIGIMACDTGMFRSVRGREAISDTRSVVIRSEISSSPICLFPIRRIDVSKTTYIMIVRMKIVVIFFAPSVSFALIICAFNQKHTVFEKNRKNVLTNGG